MTDKKKYLRAAKWTFAIITALFVTLNFIVAIQTYSFTHFDETEFRSENNIASPDTNLTSFFTGIKIPRPLTLQYPKGNYDSIQITIDSKKHICAWVLKTDSAKKGIVILFHGYLDTKSLLLDYAYEFNNMGYDALLIDFMGSGCSSGNRTTIGYKEAEDVKATFNYVKENMKEKNIILMGFSMGAAAVLKAQHYYNLPANAIIAEASYGRLLDTIRARAQIMGLGKLSTPGAYLFSFWMGVTNNIDAFGMKPEEYAKNIYIPTLIACGGKDQYIPQDETMRIFNNLNSKHKTLKFYPECKHELYIYKYADEWRKSVKTFLNKVE